MRLRDLPRVNQFAAFVAQRPSRGRLLRKLVCLVIVLSLLTLPGLDLALRQLPVVAATAIEETTDSVWLISRRLKSFFSPATPQREDGPEDRLARVAAVRVAPARFVGYQGQSVSFNALGTDAAGRTVQGVPAFSWASSSPDKVQIDDSGQATFLQPGLTTITCRAGVVTATALVLVRPGLRPQQTDAEWASDQANLSEAVTGTSALRLLPALIDHLVPTAQAQGGYSGTDFAYDEIWSEPRNLVGAPLNRAVETTRLGPVLPEGSNFSFNVPLIKLNGRGTALSLTLHYNSQVWARHGNAVTFSPVAGWPFAGFSLGFGRLVTYGPTASTKYVWVDPDGTRHYLGAGDAYTTLTYQTTDGSHLTYVGNASTGGFLYYNNGTRVTIEVRNNRLLPTRIRDRNGNYLQVAYKVGVASPLAIDYLTDTLGRQIQFQYDASGNLISITAPGYGGSAGNPITRTVAQFDYQSRTLSYTFSGLTVENAPTGAVQTLRHVYFPGTGTGSLFSYADHGMIYNVSSRRQMSVDGGGVISDGVESASVTFNYPTAGSTVLTDVPAFTQRTETAVSSPNATFSYSTSTGSGTNSYTVTRPDGSQLILTRSTQAGVDNGLLVQSEVKTSGGASMSKTVTSYTTDAGGSLVTQSAITYNDVGAPTKVDFDYDAHGNVLNQREYGFQIGGQWQVRRRTSYSYKTDQAYLDKYLRSLVTEVRIYDALENTNDADDVMIAKTAYTLDNYSVLGGMEDYNGAKPPGHDTTYRTTLTVRGNVTGTTYWTDIAANTTLPIRLNKYDKFGNLLKEQVSCCKERNYVYTQTDYWANPPEVTDGDPAALHLTGQTTFDFNTGLPKYTEFANLGKHHFYYDAALRLRERNQPTGAVETATYNDGTLSATFTKTGLGSRTEVYDGWKQVIQVTDPNNGQVNLSYDALGRLQSRTNPFPSGGTPGPATTLQYDALGRLTLATLPDNNTVQNVYSGSTLTLIDQVNRKTKRERDGLGGLTKVTEQDAAGTLTQETTYSYNLQDKLTLVNQGGQTRSFKYDALGRLLYERIPEQMATINDGTGVYWTTKYTYTDFNAVQTRTDARGVVTTYSYNGLNRLYLISYATWNAPGVAATPDVSYTYDLTNGLPLSVSHGTYQESYGYDTYKRLSSVTRTIDGRTYTTSYQYNTASQRTQITYPSTRVLNLNRDSVGRLSSLTDQAAYTYLSGVGYNAAGQTTGLTLGNGVAETYGYDPQRLQLTTQTAVKGAATLMSLTYGYQASAGQMGAGTTAGNAGQVMSVSGTINGTTESVSYTYDLWERLATASQTTNGVSMQRRFAYDRWGNRTGMWDAVSGGTQIQSVTLEQSGGAPTNRLTSVTTSGVWVSYTYDAAGNVTNDGTNVYVYDAENRIVSVNGDTYTYAYDHRNRRVRKTLAGSGTTTHYVWEGAQVLAEHDGITGGMLTDYIYSGSRMIAREQGGTRRYYVSDRLSARLTLDASGNVVGRQAHLPFGEELGASGELEKHRFTSYERDGEIGRDYAINRGYSAAVGRFLQADPYRPSGYVVDPRSWNRYSYTRNDPANRVDPSGLEDAEPFFCTNCWIEVPGGRTIDIGGATGGGIRQPFRDGSEGGPGGGGQDLSDLWDQWYNGLNRCEKKTSLRFPASIPAVRDARQAAEEVERELGGGDDNYANAVKHCTWSCIMTIRLGYRIAKAWGDAHECDANGNRQNNPGSRMDLHNNEVGRTIGYNLGSSGSNEQCITRCKASSDRKDKPDPE